MSNLDGKSAIVLLQQAVAVFNSLPAGPAKVRMADAVDTLREVLPMVLSPEESPQGFLAYADYISHEIAAARYAIVSASTPLRADQSLVEDRPGFKL